MQAGAALARHRCGRARTAAHARRARARAPRRRRRAARGAISTRSRRSATAAVRRSSARSRRSTRGFALAGAHGCARLAPSIIGRMILRIASPDRPRRSRALAADARDRRGCRAPSQARKRPAVANDDAPDVVTYGRRDDVMRFADAVAERRDLDPAWVRGALAQARFIPSVTRYIMPPAAGTAKNWAAYRSRFVEPIRIRAGVAFWRANERWLAQAEEIYGVPPEIGRRHRRRRVDLRPADGQLPRHRRARDAGLRLPRRPQGPQRLLPRRARELVRAVPERRHRPAGSGAAATPARSAWRSSCRRASTSTRSTSTATATSTCTTARPT